MKIIDNRKEKISPKIRLGNIPVSTTFTGNIGSYTGLFLRTYSGVVFLKNPIHTWDGDSSEFENYNPVNVKVTITGNAT